MLMFTPYDLWFESYDFIPELELTLEDYANADIVALCGGADISPSIYGERNTYSHCQPARDEIEIRYIKKALQDGKKLFGVCRGHQLLNALFGGLLVQDITTELGQFHGGSHQITGKIGTTYVNSLHHQGVIRVGQGLESLADFGSCSEITVGKVARSKVFSVQFHPELDHDEVFLNLFKEFAF